MDGALNDGAKFDIWEGGVSAPLIAWFEDRGLLAVVDGLGSEDEVFGRLCDAVQAADSVGNGVSA